MKKNDTNQTADARIRYDFSKDGEELRETSSEDMLKCRSIMHKVFIDNGITDTTIIREATIALILIHYIFNLDLDNIIKYIYTEYGHSFFEEYIKVEKDMNKELVILDTKHTISKRFRL